ncbi:MAG: hypothetical protein ACYCZM_12080, partial [Acidimicrobiales bacterium]
VMQFIEYFNAITEDRQKCPTDDLASVIANGQPGGCPMGEAERLWYYIIVATAGHDTTSFALSGGMQAMLAKLSRQLVHIEPAGPAQWSESSFVSGVKHLPMRYSFR